MLTPSLGRALAFCAAALLSACISFATRKGYEPLAPAVLYAGALPPQSPDTVQVTLPAGVLVLVQATRGEIHPTSGAQLGLNVSLLVPAGVNVQLLAPELILASTEWNATRTLPVVCIEDWSASPRRIHAPDAWLSGTSLTDTYPGFGLSLVAEGPRGQSRIPAVAEFELRLPAFRVEDELVAPGPLRFRACERSGPWLAPD